jgi:hypothetical protein
MSAGATRKRPIAIAALVATGLLLVVAANWHLVYVAISSQPDCVAHVRPSQGTEGLRFGAAVSSCASPVRE